jgi:hypothetical protein
MTARQVLVLAAGLFLALILTIAAGFVLEPVPADPLGAGPWWDTLLRILVPAVWVFLFVLAAIWGVIALIALLQGRRGVM